jgi:hypothetical protein
MASVVVTGVPGGAEISADVKGKQDLVQVGKPLQDEFDVHCCLKRNDQ